MVSILLLLNTSKLIESSLFHLQVEWDRIPEVQHSNEVQAITTSTNDVNEFQIIQSTATPQGEIQTSTVDALYSFSLVLGTTNSGVSIQYSGQISATADASGSRSSIEESQGESMVKLTSVAAA